MWELLAVFYINIRSAMKILAIETSCDETAVSLLEAGGDIESAHFSVLGNALYSQAQLHSKYGGVYPTLAKREHSHNLVPLLTDALKQAGMLTPATNTLTDKQTKTLHTLLVREPTLFDRVVEFLRTFEAPAIDVVAVTRGPGLEPALWVGVNFARALSAVWNVPAVPVNHMEGHIISAVVHPPKEHEFVMEQTNFPVLALLVSGGHTELVLAKAWGDYTVVGQTRDDAVGEAYDKVARMLDLGYPGGSAVAKLAAEGRRTAFHKVASDEHEACTLPRPMLSSGDFNFSFSGIKTAVLYHIKKLDSLTERAKMLIATEFESAVVEVLVKKTKKAVELHQPKTVVVGGGVSANSFLRESLTNMLQDVAPSTALRLPDKTLTGDNALMIGMAGYIASRATVPETHDSEELHADGALRL